MATEDMAVTEAIQGKGGAAVPVRLTDQPVQREVLVARARRCW